jgi:hypothetical protein
MADAPTPGARWQHGCLCKVSECWHAVHRKGTRGALHSHNFKKVDESVTKSLDSWRTQYLISGTGLVGAFRPKGWR